MNKEAYNHGDIVKGTEEPWLGLVGEVTKIATPSNKWLHVVNEHAFGTYKAISVVAVLESEVELVSCAPSTVKPSSTAMKILSLTSN